MKTRILKYKLERRSMPVKCGWFKKQDELFWCIVEYYVSTWVDCDQTGCETRESESSRIVFRTKDEDQAVKEFENFCNNLK